MNKSIKYSLTSLSCLGICLPVSAELTLSPVLESNLYYFEEVYSDTVQFEGETAYEFIPSLNINYKTKSVSSDWLLKLRHINHGDEQIENQNITEFNGNNNVSLFSDLIDFDFGLSRSQKALSQGQSFLNDPLYGQANMTDLETYNAGLRFNGFKNAWLKSNFSLNVVQTKYDEDDIEFDSDVPLFSSYVNGEQYSASGMLGFGGKVGQAYGNLNFSASANDKDGFDTQKRQSASINLGLPILEALSVTANARHEKNETGRNSDLGSYSSDDLNYDSWGMGLSWHLSNDSYFGASYNRSDQNGGEDFISYELNLKPSERTSLIAEYSRRFYGDAGSIAFSWQHKHLSSSLTYSEDVRSRSRFSTNNISLGEFVCADEVVEINDCFVLPDDNFELQEGQRKTELFGDELVIENQITLNKSTNFNLSYQFKQLDIAFDLNNTDRTLFADDSEQNDISARLSTSLKLGRKSTVSFAVQAQQRDYSYEQEKQDTYSVDTSYERKLTEKLQASINYRYSSRETSLYGDLEDSRLWLNMKYSF